MKMKKICNSCLLEKPISEFYKDKSHSDGVRTRCKECVKEVHRCYHEVNRDKISKQKAEYRLKNLEGIREKERKYAVEHRAERKVYMHTYYRANVKMAILGMAKWRATKDDRLFQLTVDDVPDIPSHCPLLGIPLEIGDGKVESNSPTLDCMLPQYGYVPSNVWIISSKANRIKNNATLVELELLVLNLRRKMEELCSTLKRT